MHAAQKKISIPEKFFVKSGKVVAVRGWNGGNVQEIDVYLPSVNFEKWNQAHTIKCRISALHYTDYTPAMWNTDKKTCTIYIDTSHRGQGSIWTKNQVAGNDFYYSKTEAGKHFPIDGKHLVFLGDQTGIGHFCSLRQLAASHTQISGFIAFNDLQTADAFYENCSWLPLHAVLNDGSIIEKPEDWIMKYRAEKENFVFYVVGGAELIVSLRKLLRTYGFDGSQIRSKGFWH